MAKKAGKRWLPSPLKQLKPKVPPERETIS